MVVGIVAEQVDDWADLMHIVAKKWNEEKEKVLSLLAYVLDRGAEWFEKEWIRMKDGF